MDTRQGSDKDKGTRGDVMVQSLWYWKNEAIIDVKPSNADSDSDKYEPIVAQLDWWETIKKYNHCNHYHDQWKYFYPFLISVNDIIGREAVVILAQLSQIMAEKCTNPFCTCVAGRTVKPQLWLQYCTHK